MTVKLIFSRRDAATINLSERTTARIRRAVASGTGYMGMCCGAFVAAEAVASAPHIYGERLGSVLAIFPGTAEWACGEGVLPFSWESATGGCPFATTASTDA